LSIQEGRLRRQREKDTAVLHQLQKHREDQKTKRLNAAAKAYIEAVDNNCHEAFEPEELGFEFSMAQIESALSKSAPTSLPSGPATKPMTN
jgi:hypothetical protein